MKCREYADKLIREGWKVAGLEGDNLILSKNGQLQTIDLRFDSSVKATGTAAGWTNSTNVYSSDNAYATYTRATVGYSPYLICYNFGFAIPTSTINGISVKVEAHAEYAVNVHESNIYLGTYRGSFTTKGTDQVNNTDFQTSDTNIISGSSTNLWGTTWTSENFNSSTFGVEFRCVYSDADTASIDYVEITVYYTPSIAFIPQVIII